VDLEEEESVVVVNNEMKLKNPQLVDSTVVFTIDKMFAIK